MLETGSVIDGKYKILYQIGRGGMSRVYLAINEKANKTWAVKEVRRDETVDEQMVRRRLMAETELLKRLRNSHLPRIVDVIDKEGSLLIVMDYIEGNSLESLLAEEGPQPQERVISWGKQLCEVLGYLHRQNPPVIYRDMKPSNVMLQSDGTVMLIDFGTAREQREQKTGDDTVCLGTPGYAAPEQWGGRGQTDARTDIYCLGAALYHLAAGQNLLELPCDADEVSEGELGLSPGFKAILLKCTRKDPKERYQSCEELLYALEHYEEMDSRYRRKQKRRAGMFFLVFLLALIFGFSGSAAYAKEQRLAADTWQAWMERAMSETEREAQIASYGQAIRLEPGKADGYLELLERVFLAVREDGSVCFSKEDEQYLRRLFRTETFGGKTRERVLKENPEEYDRLSYRLGLAYYYDYEGEGAKPYALKWLLTAAESETLPAECRERARRLGAIAGYYARLGLMDKAGDIQISYLDYWRDLKGLTEGNVAALDNPVTALRIYRELAGQAAGRWTEFQKAGVLQEEIEEKLREIQIHLEQDFTEGDWKQPGLWQMRLEVEGLLQEAIRQTEAVYECEELGKEV